MQRGAIILCGGLSSRMGSDKAMLSFGDETLLERMVPIVSSVIDPTHVVIVAGAHQTLPPLGSELILARDTEDYAGPLVALSRGIVALPADTEAAFVTGCDTPFLLPQIIEHLFAVLADFEAAVPHDAERSHPLCAVYQTTVETTVARRIIAYEQRSLRHWLDQLRVRLIPVESLRSVDPQLQSFRNVNTREDYLAALAAAGLPIP